MQRDIQDRDDLETLMRHFYTRVLGDPIIGFYFNDIADFDLEEHIPRICDFWEQQMFGKLGYNGRTFEAHLALHRHAALTAHHFHRWLHLFIESVDACFAGPLAEAIKRRAQRIAESMRDGLERFETERTSEPGVQSFEP